MQALKAFVAGLPFLMLATPSPADEFTSTLRFPTYLSGGVPTAHQDPYRTDSIDVDPSSTFKVTSKTETDYAVAGTVIDDALGIVYYGFSKNSSDPNLHAYYLRSENGHSKGQLAWDSSKFGIQLDPCSVLSVNTLDENHNIYFYDCKNLYSATSDGKLRWKTPLPNSGAVYAEVFLTPTGDVGGITTSGVFGIHNSQTGAPLTSFFSLPGVYTGGGAFSISPTEASCIGKTASGGYFTDPLIGFTSARPGQIQGSAISPSPAIMLDAKDPLLVHVFAIAMMANPTNSAPFDTKLFRVDVQYSQSGAIQNAAVASSFDGLIPGGNGSRTAPTIAPNGLEIYVTDTKGGFYALSTSTGQILWRQSLGVQIQSPAVSRSLQNLVYAGIGTPKLQVMDPSQAGKIVVEQDYNSLAVNELPAFQDLPRTAKISTNILVSPSKLTFTILLGYDVTSIMGPKNISVDQWPMKSYFVVTDLSGNILSKLALDIAESHAIAPLRGTNQSGKQQLELYLSSSVYNQSVPYCLKHSHKSQFGYLPEPMVPTGGRVTLSPVTN